MMKNITYITISLGIIMLSIIGIYIVKNKNINKMKSFENKIYNIKYDSTWKVTKRDDDKIVLKHSNGQVDIDIIKLPNNKKYESINTLIDDLVSSLSNQNSDYSLIGKEESKLTKRNIDGYKLLFENNDSQVLIDIVKINDKLIIYRYEANNDYFDILLDSAQNIINNFELKKYEVEYDLVREITDEKLEYEGNEEIKDVKNVEISSNHYKVNYKIPKDYKISYFDSHSGAYQKDDIIITTSVVSYNLYQFCESDDAMSISKIVERKKSQDKISDVTVTSSKGYIDNSYIYLIRYKYDGNSLEELYYVIPLDNSHIFIYKLETSRDAKISESLIQSLDINSKEKYSKNIEKNYEDGYLVNDMKSKNYNNEYINLKLYTPKVYEEIDNNLNVYEDRFFGKNYNNRTNEYDIKLSYYLSRTKNCSYNNDSIKGSYSSYKDVVLGKVYNQKLNNYNYSIYDVKYKYGSRLIYEKNLSTRINDEYCFEISIKSNNKINENLSELTKFKYEIKNME